jgi:hypothetical protein
VVELGLRVRPNVPSTEDAAGNPFAETVFAAADVASVFGVNDFVTTRVVFAGRV